LGREDRERMKMEKGKWKMGRGGSFGTDCRLAEWEGYTESGQRKALLSPPHPNRIAEDILVVKSNVGSVRIEW
jgi:hypothetical protein